METALHSAAARRSDADFASCSAHPVAGAADGARDWRCSACRRPAGRRHCWPAATAGERQQMVFQMSRHAAAPRARRWRRHRAAPAPTTIRNAARVNASSAWMSRPSTTRRRRSSRCSRRPLAITNSRPRTTPRVSQTDQPAGRHPQLAQPGRGVIPARHQPTRCHASVAHDSALRGFDGTRPDRLRRQTRSGHRSGRPTRSVPAVPGRPSSTP